MKHINNRTTRKPFLEHYNEKCQKMILIKYFDYIYFLPHIYVFCVFVTLIPVFLLPFMFSLKQIILLSTSYGKFTKKKLSAKRKRQKERKKIVVHVKLKSMVNIILKELIIKNCP